jgi:hypothetical protein
MSGGTTLIMKRDEVYALIAAAKALAQCVDDFGESGQSVCLQAKQEAITALAAIRAAGIDLDE